MVLGLSSEELTLVTAAMNIPSFLGFTSPGAMPGEAAAAGERSLRARGLAEVTPENGGTLTVSTELIRLLSVCAVPTHALIVMSDFPDGGLIDPYQVEGEQEKAKAHFFCFRDTDMVYHNRSLPGLHTFTSLSEPDTLKIILAAILEAEDPAARPDAPAETYPVDRESLVNAQALKYGDGPEAVYDRLFNDLNAPHSLARALAYNSQFVVYLVRRNDWQSGDYGWTDKTQIEDAGCFVVPAEEGGLWVYTFEGSDPLMAYFNPMSAEAFIDDTVNRLHATMSQG